MTSRGLVQIKCPEAATHYETIRKVRQWQDHYDAANALKDCADSSQLAQSREASGALEINRVRLTLPGEYVPQLRHEMFVTDADWIDYVSYHPAFPVKLQLITIRVLRDDLGLSEYANDVKAFLAEVDAECEQIAEWAR